MSNFINFNPFDEYDKFLHRYKHIFEPYVNSEETFVKLNFLCPVCHQITERISELDTPFQFSETISGTDIKVKKVLYSTCNNCPNSQISIESEEENRTNVIKQYFERLGVECFVNIIDNTCKVSITNNNNIKLDLPEDVFVSHTHKNRSDGIVEILTFAVTLENLHILENIASSGSADSRLYSTFCSWMLENKISKDEILKYKGKSHIVDRYISDHI